MIGQSAVNNTMILVTINIIILILNMPTTAMANRAQHRYGARYKIHKMQNGTVTQLFHPNTVPQRFAF